MARSSDSLPANARLRPSNRVGPQGNYVPAQKGCRARFRFTLRSTTQADRAFWRMNRGMASTLPPKDKIGARTPMRCPVCDRDLRNVLVRDLGGVTASLVWQLHAGECPEHGWFQAEVISRPPREIFAVDRPFGVARRMEIDGDEVYAFATVW